MPTWMYPYKSGIFVRSLFPIPIIFASCGYPQITYPIVCTYFIYVVNFHFRHLPIIKEPCNSVCLELFTFYLQD